MPVIGSDSEILKEYLGPNPLGNVYLGGTQIQSGTVSTVGTPWYWFNPDVAPTSPDYLTGSNATAWSSSNATNVDSVDYLEVYNDATSYYQGKPKHFQPVNDAGYIRMKSSDGALTDLIIDGYNTSVETTWNFWVNVTGSTDYVRDARLVRTEEASSNATNYQFLLSDGGGSGSAAYGLFIYPGNNAISFGDLPLIAYGGSGSWVNFTMTTEGTGGPVLGRYPQITCKGYLNGEYVYQQTFDDSNFNANSRTINTMYVGATSGPILDSKVGDMMFYRSKLSAGEIKQNYQALVRKYYG